MMKKRKWWLAKKLIMPPNLQGSIHLHHLTLMFILYLSLKGLQSPKNRNKKRRFWTLSKRCRSIFHCLRILSKFPSMLNSERIYVSSNALQKPFIRNKAKCALMVLMDIKSKFKIKFLL